ncbi:membrane protein [Marinosulfonomonas sp. PRT-SC04]|nr:membrane protein [Marinosulfonomonas sp. PRT-SC04]
MRLVWLILGLSSLILGAIGAILPLLPTVPFMLLAAFFFSKSSERLHHWLLTHPIFGPPIDDWQRNGAITKQIKLYSTASIAAAFGLSLILGIRLPILILQGCILVAVLFFIWTRPEA